MYSILHETDDATSVNFSVWGEFLPRKGKQLATAGAKALKFYRLSPYSTGNGQSTSKLECFLSFTLMAPIRGMTVVRLQDYFECDALALTFDDAKISIVNINPATMSLNTLSLHSLEDDFLRDGYSKDIYCPELRVDPESRCCAFTVYGRHLAIVPFQKHHRVNRVTNNQMGRGALQIMLQSYSIKFRSLDARLENVHDLCFLHGYYEPTLLFLYEPIQTTAGRACVRYDTVCILGVSLNLKDRLHAIVWNFSGLPLTVDRCLPIRQPLGGVCLFGANEIVYLNQSVPPHGISLNSCSDEYSRLPLSCKQQNMRITLDGCAVQTLPDIPNDILVISREGHLYILTLETDQANVVRGMQLKQTFETSIPCTLSVCSSNLLFVGSRLGDSQLLHFDWQQRKPSNDLNTALFNNHSRILFDDDDYFLYGEEFCQNFVMEESLTQAVRMYNFKLVDTLPNVGPCKWLRTCAPNDISDAFRKNPSDIYFDMMTTSGHGKDSSLCFFQRTIRPQIVTSTFLEGAQRIWTVGKRPDGTQQYLVISRERSTNVLELANDMVELDAEIFCYTESTILAGDMANGMISMQITPTSIVLVANGQQIDMMAVDSNFPVISASIMDPFIVLLTLNGRFFLYQLISNDNSFNLQQVFDNQ